MPNTEITLDYESVEDVNRAASLIAQFMREGVTFKVEQAGDHLLVTMLGGY
jgi:hypothetical protein